MISLFLCLAFGMHFTQLRWEFGIRSILNFCTCLMLESPAYSILSAFLELLVNAFYIFSCLSLSLCLGHPVVFFLCLASTQWHLRTLIL